MSSHWVIDIKTMSAHFGVKKTVADFDKERLATFLKFRLDFLKEELKEANDAETAEDVVDAMIDLCVVAIGTLEAFDVDINRAWDEVLKANMAKVVGLKASRPHPLGLPDLIKSVGWVPPDHTGNTGLLDLVFPQENSDDPS